MPYSYVVNYILCDTTTGHEGQFVLPSWLASSYYGFWLLLGEIVCKESGPFCNCFGWSSMLLHCIEDIDFSANSNLKRQDANRKR